MEPDRKYDYLLRLLVVGSTDHKINSLAMQKFVCSDVVSDLPIDFVASIAELDALRFKIQLWALLHDCMDD
jgi:hypothetical protein